LTKLITKVSSESRELLDISVKVMKIREISILAFGEADGPFVTHAELALGSAYMAEYLSLRKLRRTKTCVSEAFDLLFESYVRGDAVEAAVLAKFDEAGELYLSPEDISAGVGADVLVKKRLELKEKS